MGPHLYKAVKGTISKNKGGFIKISKANFIYFSSSFIQIGELRNNNSDI